MTKYTPGPFEVRGGMNLYDERERLVASAWSGGGISDEEQEANARLLAAAPNMLDALKNAAELIDGMSCDCLPDDYDVFQIDKIIKKAEGGQ